MFAPSQAEREIGSGDESIGPSEVKIERPDTLAGGPLRKPLRFLSGIPHSDSGEALLQLRNEQMLVVEPADVRRLLKPGEVALE